MYLTKADKDPAVFGISIKEALNTRGSSGIRETQGVIAAMIEEGATLNKVNAEHPGFMMMNLRSVSTYHAWRSILGKRGRPSSWHGAATSSDYEWNKEIVDWLNTNIKRPRRFKQKQLYIYGPPDVGKTHLLDQLREALMCYELPKEDFYDLWEDDAYDLCIMDEFKGHKAVTFLNEFLQGSRMCIRKKGSQALKSHNIPTIICSNYSPEEAYSKCGDMAIASLRSRIDVVYVAAARLDITLQSAPTEVMEPLDLAAESISGLGEELDDSVEVGGGAVVGDLDELEDISSLELPHSLRVAAGVVDSGASAESLHGAEHPASEDV